MGVPYRLTSPMAAVVAVMGANPADGCPTLDLARSAGIASGTLYAALMRLERIGWVASSWVLADPELPPRRQYALTAAARFAVGSSVRDTASPPPTAADRARRRGHLIVGWSIVAVVAVVQGVQALSRPAPQRLSDLAVYVGAVTGLRHGHGLYEFSAANGAPFTYPPFAGLVFWPLTFIATRPLQVAWTVATIATVLGLSVVAARRTRLPAAVLATFGLLAAPVSSDLRFGQVSVFLAGLVTLDVATGRTGRWRGAVTGVAAAIKLTPLIFIPLLWRGGRRRAALLAGAVFIACAAMAYAILPADSRRYWGWAMWHVERLGRVWSAGNQSFDGALLRFGIADPARSVLSALVAGVVAIVALRRAGWVARSGDWLSALVLVGAASIVVSPVSWTHHQAWLVMAAALPVSASARVRAAWAAVVLTVMLLQVTTAGAALGWPILENARLLLAVAVAGVVPIVSVARPLDLQRPAGSAPLTRAAT